MSITILTEADIRRCVSMDLEALAAVEQGFAALSAGNAVVPPILQLMISDHRGEVDVKTAYIRGLESFAIKIASGFLDNASLGLPTGSGMMALFSASTGALQALLLDNGYLTDVRTGLAGAAAAKYLAPQTVSTVGVIGSGIQSRFQTRAIRLVRPFQRLLLYGTNPASVSGFQREMAQELGIEIQIADGYEQVVRESEILVTTTPTAVPFVKVEWLHPGQHITCMGSDSPHKQEIEVEVFGQADRIVCDRKEQCLQIGELHHAFSAGVMGPETGIIEIGDIIRGVKPGRVSPDEITICDLTGVGVQDTAIAILAYQRARENHLGSIIS